MDRILITGIDSPLGRQLALVLRAQGLAILGTCSRTAVELPEDVPAAPLPDPENGKAWLDLLDGISQVIALDDHAASFDVPLKDRLPDLAITGRLAGAAAARQIKRFSYLSSVQAMTDHTQPGKPLAWRGFYHPGNRYGRLKLESERMVARHCAPAGVGWQFIRVPEVYGPGLDSTVSRLAALVRHRRLLTVPAARNELAFVHVANLATAMAVAITHERGDNEALPVSDGQNLSTAELLRYIAHALNRWLVLVPLPAFCFGSRRQEPDPLAPDPLIPLHSLALDDSHTRQAIDWQPILSPLEGIRDAVGSTRDQQNEM